MALWLEVNLPQLIPMTEAKVQSFREAYSLAESMWNHGLSHVWLPRIQGFTCTDVGKKNFVLLLFSYLHHNINISCLNVFLTS